MIHQVQKSFRSTTFGICFFSWLRDYHTPRPGKISTSINRII